MRNVSVRRLFRDSSARVQHESAPAEQDAKALVSARRVRDDRSPALPEYDGREWNGETDAVKRYQRATHGRLHLSVVLFFSRQKYHLFAVYCFVLRYDNVYYKSFYIID